MVATQKKGMEKGPPTPAWEIPGGEGANQEADAKVFPQKLLSSLGKLIFVIWRSVLIPGECYLPLEADNTRWKQVCTIPLTQIVPVT